MDKPETTKILSDKEMNEIFHSSLNATIEMGVAYKLFVHRMINQQNFITRVKEIGETNLNVFNAITDNGKASYEFKASSASQTDEIGKTSS